MGPGAREDRQITTPQMLTGNTLADILSRTSDVCQTVCRGGEGCARAFTCLETSRTVVSSEAISLVWLSLFDWTLTTESGFGPITMRFVGAASPLHLSAAHHEPLKQPCPSWFTQRPQQTIRTQWVVRFMDALLAEAQHSTAPYVVPPSRRSQPLIGPQATA